MDQEVSTLATVAVDTDNFVEIYDYIIDRKLIEKSEFIAFDLEMTGIKGDYADYFEEPPVERYLKLRKVAMKYSIIQIGLSFNIKVSENKYECSAFTFFLFPGEDDRVIGMQVGAVQFNSLHGMDWNRWIKKGINFQNEKQDQRKKDEFTSSVDNSEQSQSNRQSQDETTYQSMKEKMSEEDTIKVDLLIQKIDTYIINEQKELNLGQLNSYYKKSLYSYIGFKYPNLMARSIQGEFLLMKVTEEERKNIEESIKKEKTNKYDLCLGFTKLWKDVIAAKKIMVGHNCFADLTFLFSHLVDTPPISYEEFKLEILKRVGSLYDTKYIFEQCPSLEILRNKIDAFTTLENLEKFLKSYEGIKSIDCEAKLDIQQSSTSFHDAGFDALITAKVFASLYNNITEEEKNAVKNFVPSRCSIYVINLKGEDKQINNNSYFYVQLPQNKNQQLSNRQFTQECQKMIEDKFKAVLSDSNVSGHIVNFRYFVFVVRPANGLNILEIEKSIKFITSEMKDYQYMSQVKYEQSRRDFKEKDAKGDKFDKK